MLHKIERKKKQCKIKIIKTNSYSVLNAEKYSNFQRKTKNFMPKKVILHLKDALNAVKTEKQETTTQGADIAQKDATTM